MAKSTRVVRPAYYAASSISAKQASVSNDVYALFALSNRPSSGFKYVFNAPLVVYGGPFMLVTAVTDAWELATPTGGYDPYITNNSVAGTLADTTFGGNPGDYGANITDDFAEGDAGVPDADAGLLTQEVFDVNNSPQGFQWHRYTAGQTVPSSIIPDVDENRVLFVRFGPFLNADSAAKKARYAPGLIWAFDKVAV